MRIEQIKKTDEGNLLTVALAKICVLQGSEPTAANFDIILAELNNTWRKYSVGKVLQSLATPTRETQLIEAGFELCEDGFYRASNLAGYRLETINILNDEDFKTILEGGRLELLRLRQLEEEKTETDFTNGL